MNIENPHEIKLDNDWFKKETKKKWEVEAEQPRIVPSEGQKADRRAAEHARREREAEARVQAWFDTGMEPKDREHNLKADIAQFEVEFEEMEPDKNEKRERFNRRSEAALEKLESAKMELAVLERRLKELINPAEQISRAQAFVENALKVEGVAPSELSRTIQEDITRTKLSLRDAEFGSTHQQIARKHLDARTEQLVYLRSLQSDPTFVERLEEQRAEQQEAVAKAKKERKAADAFSLARTVGQTITPEMYNTGVENLPRLEDEAEIVNAPERPPIYDPEDDKDTASGESVVSELPVEAIAPLEDERLGEEPGEAVGMEAAEAADRLKAEPVTVEQPRPVIAKKMKPVPIPYPEPVVSGGLNPTYAAPKSVERIQPEKYHLGKLVTDTARQVGGWFKGLFGKSSSSEIVDKGHVYASTEDIKTTQAADRHNKKVNEYGKRALNQNAREVAEPRNRVESAVLHDEESINLNNRITSRKKAGADSNEISGLEKRLQARRKTIEAKLKRPKKTTVEEAAAAK